MVRILRAGEIALVASDAGSTRQVVAAKLRVVAIGALARGDGMHPRQGEAGGAVIELAIRPGRGVMTLFAGGRKTGVRHGTDGAGEILLVAGNARSIRDVVVVVDVAVDAHAWRVLVHARQGKSGLRVIELAIRPLHGVVTVFAILGETLVRHGAGRVVEIFLVARNTSRACEVEVVVDVAIRTGAGRVRVPARQRESHRIVIKLRVQPVVRSMALVTGCRVREDDVIRRFRVLEVRFMARIAHRGHDLEFAVGRVLVAGIAIDGGVSAGQGEAIIVLLNFLNRYCPSTHAVALLAIRTELAFVNIGMAVLAARAHIAEHRLHVALRTSHVLVKAAQRVTGAVVIKFGNGADRLPALRSVAVLAGNVQIAMRAIGTRGTLVRPTRNRDEEKQ